MIDQEPYAARSPFPKEIAAGEVVLTLISGQVFVNFADTLSRENIKAILAQHRLQPVKRARGILPHIDVGEAPLRMEWLQWTTGEDTPRVIAELRADDRVRTASPLYHRADHFPMDAATSFADQVLVHFGPGTSEEEISALIAASDTEKVAAEPFVRAGVVYQLRLRHPKQQNIFAIVDAFARSPLVRYAGPDWIQLQSPASTTTPNDEKFGEQWNLRAISAPRGWDYTQGTRLVVIAIIDSGCDLNHPDLVGKYVPEADHFDVLAGRFAPPNPAYGHGTWCAGIAAAQTNNMIGVAGVAPNCLIMPIRLYDGRENTGGILSQHDIMRAINWARTHGADVISMSWHYDGLPHELADIALMNAYEANVVLVAAAGNCSSQDGCTDPTFIQFPASHRDVLAVGGSDQNDHRQNRNTSNFTPKFDSMYGPKLSVVAPAMLCPTTDIGGGYTTFYGTSASAPHVAGLAALLLSWRPATGRYGPVWYNTPKNDLTNDQVKHFIEASAEKVGGYTYNNDPLHPHGTWNLEMGYGRINIARALDFLLDQSFERVSRDYAHSVLILLGLVGGGSGVVLPPGGPPVPVDPGWLHLTPEKRDVLLSLAITELAEGVNDRETRRALGQAGWNAIARTAQRMGQAF